MERAIPVVLFFRFIIYVMRKLNRIDYRDICFSISHIAGEVAELNAAISLATRAWKEMLPRKILELNPQPVAFTVARLCSYVKTGNKYKDEK